MNTRDVNTMMDGVAVRAWVARMKLRCYKVLEFGVDGYSVEIDGTQIFRATLSSPERYQVRYNEQVFPDV